MNSEKVINPMIRINTFGYEACVMCMSFVFILYIYIFLMNYCERVFKEISTCKISHQVVVIKCFRKKNLRSMFYFNKFSKLLKTKVL